MFSYGNYWLIPAEFTLLYLFLNQTCGFRKRGTAWCIAIFAAACTVTLSLVPWERLWQFAMLTVAEYALFIAAGMTAKDEPTKRLVLSALAATLFSACRLGIAACLLLNIFPPNALHSPGGQVLGLQISCLAAEIACTYLFARRFRKQFSLPAGRGATMFALLTTTYVALNVTLQVIVSSGAHVIPYGMAMGICSILCLSLVLAICWMGSYREAERRTAGHLDAVRSAHSAALQMADELRAREHEYRHHLTVLKAYADHEDVKNLKAYIDDLLHDASCANSPIYTGNSVLDALLARAERTASRNGIVLSIDSKRLPALAASANAVTEIAANMLENALEAAQRCSDPERTSIHVEIFAAQRMASIRVSNPVPAENSARKSFRSSKHGVHGYGLRNIRRQVERAEGFLEIEEQSAVFSIQVWLPLQKAETPENTSVTNDVVARIMRNEG